MKTLIVTALALVIVALGGCANMPGGVIGTGAGYDAFDRSAQSVGAWPTQRHLIDD